MLGSRVGRSGSQLRRLAALFVASAVAICACAAQGSWLSAPESIAPGIEYYTSTDQTLSDPAGPTAVFLLKLDPAKVQLDSVHAKNQIMGDVDAFDIDALDNLIPPLTGLGVGDLFLEKLEFDSVGDGPFNVTFATTFFGLTYFGLHTGKGNTGDHPGANSTACTSTSG